MTDSEEDHDKISPNAAQRAVIQSDEYPQRVLAGAGTGKTYTMVEKIRTLIEEEGVPPEEILALTFTNKAAASMRSKLTDSVGPRAHDIDAYTYHAIGRELLAEFGYYGSFDPRSELADGAEQLRIIYDCLDEIDYQFTAPQAAPPDGPRPMTEEDLSSFITETKSEGITPQAVAEYLPDTQALVDLGTVPDQIREDAQDLLRDQTTPSSPAEVDDAIGNVETFINRLQTHKANLGDSDAAQDVAAFLEVFVDICQAIIETFEANRSAIIDGEYRAFGRVPGYLFNTYSRGATGVKQLEVTPLDRLQSFIEELQAAADFTDGYAAYEAALESGDLMDYDDLVIEAKRLLATNESVRQWVTDRWSYVFCDEFQDTDSVQFDLIQQIAADANLFVVGDDDQSIYEWRGANMENITTDFREAYPDFRGFELEANYRSREPILSLADTAISQLERRESTKTLTPTADRAGASTGVAVSEEDDPAAEATQIAAAIKRLQSGTAPEVSEQFEVGDVAILVRNTDHAGPIRQALTAHGIPYELVGGLASDATGIKTISAYLRVLNNHDDEVSLNRVLMLCYRLPESDLVRLNRHDQLWHTLQDCTPAEFDDPAAVQRAQTDLRELSTVAKTQSLSTLYDEIKQRTRIDLFLRDDQRKELQYFDDIIEQFSDSPVETVLDQRVIEYLEFAVHSLSESGTSGDQPEPADDVVTIMTVHKAKGLEFPVVFVPRLESDQWSPQQQSFRQLQSGLHKSSGNNPEVGPATADFLRRQRDEQQRVFHVAATRAEDLLVLSGSGPGAQHDTETVTADAIQALYPDHVEWGATPGTFNIWELVTSSLPATAVDWTGQSWTTDASRPALRDGNQVLDVDQATDRLITIASQALAGALEGSLDQQITDRPTSGVASRDPQLRQQFSYSAIDAYRTCPRQYYLEYVLAAYDDGLVAPSGDHSGTAHSGVSRKAVGTLFHRTAEEAAGLDAADRETWQSIADQLAASDPRITPQALEVVNDCIDRYFESAVSDWTVIATERQFEVGFPLSSTEQDSGRFPVVGAIDAIYRDSQGERVIVDYKTGYSTAGHDLQRAIYVLAANQLLGGGDGIPWNENSPAMGTDQITRAGMLHLGPDGPQFDEQVYSSAELRQLEREIVAELQEMTAADYETFNAGDHCQYCPHASLPCNPATGAVSQDW